MDIVSQRVHNQAAKGNKINSKRHNKHWESKQTMNAFVLTATIDVGCSCNPRRLNTRVHVTSRLLLFRREQSMDKMTRPISTLPTKPSLSALVTVLPLFEYVMPLSSTLFVAFHPSLFLFSSTTFN